MKEKLLLLLKTYALSKKPTLLASGVHSDIYIDCRQVYFQGEALDLIGKLLWRELSLLEHDRRFDACGGMALGAAPLCCALAHRAFNHNRSIPGLIVRKEAKNHGLMCKIEGLKAVAPHAHVILLEDVITTAQSALNAASVLRDAGFSVSHVLALIDREQGGRYKLEEAQIELKSLFTLKDFDYYVDRDERAL
jgi:orotate phosphoribosyltransferase